MAYEVRVIEDDQIVELRFSGPGDHAEHVAARDEVFEHCRQRKMDRILVDLRDAVMNLSSQEIYQLGQSLANQPEPQNIRFAVVIREHDAAPDMTAAIAQLKQVNIRVFLSAADARHWLRAQALDG